MSLSRNRFYLAESRIHGKGIFSSHALQPGESIGEAICFDWFGLWPYITKDLGVWINHSYTANARLEWMPGQHPLQSGAWHIAALGPLPANTELTLDYRETPFYIEGPLAHYT